MTHCLCMVQQNRIDPIQHQSLMAEIAAFTHREWGEAIPVHWLEIAEGNGYSAGVPSTVSFLNVQSPEPLSQPRRETLMYALSTLWINATGCSEDELVVVVADPRT